MGYAVGQKLLASQLNDPTPTGDIDLGDDLLMATGGQIVWSSDTNLYRGAANQLKTDDDLTVVGLLTATTNARVGRPVLQMRQVTGSTQTLTASTPAAITMTGEDIDTLNAHSTVSNTSRFTPNVAGTYAFWGQLCVATGTALTMVTQFRLNGNQTLRAPYAMFTTTTQAFAFNTARCAALIQMNGTTDYVELYGNVSSTIATAANATDACSWVMAEYWGP